MSWQIKVKNDMKSKLAKTNYITWIFPDLSLSWQTNVFKINKKHKLRHFTLTVREHRFIQISGVSGCFALLEDIIITLISEVMSSALSCCSKQGKAQKKIQHIIWKTLPLTKHWLICCQYHIDISYILFCCVIVERI